MLTFKIDTTITIKFLDEQYADAIFEIVENYREQFSPWLYHSFINRIKNLKNKHTYKFF